MWVTFTWSILSDQNVFLIFLYCAGSCDIFLFQTLIWQRQLHAISTTKRTCYPFKEKGPPTKEKELEQKNVDITRLKAELELVIQKKNEEIEKSRAKMKRTSAKNFRLGWNQALTREEDRYYKGLDSFDVYYGFPPMSYSLVQDITPKDLPWPEASIFDRMKKKVIEDKASSANLSKLA